MKISNARKDNTTYFNDRWLKNHYILLNETLLVGQGLKLVCLSMASKDMHEPVLITQSLVPYLIPHCWEGKECFCLLQMTSLNPRVECFKKSYTFEIYVWKNNIHLRHMSGKLIYFSDLNFWKSLENETFQTIVNPVLL